MSLQGSAGPQMLLQPECGQDFGCAVAAVTHDRSQVFRWRPRLDMMPHIQDREEPLAAESAGCGPDGRARHPHRTNSPGLIVSAMSSVAAEIPRQFRTGAGHLPHQRRATTRSPGLHLQLREPSSWAPPSRPCRPQRLMLLSAGTSDLRAEAEQEQRRRPPQAQHPESNRELRPLT